MKNPFVEKKVGKNDESKLVGGYIPIHTANYLRLYSIHKGKSLQSLLIEILTSWKVMEGLSPELMIETLAQKAYREWEKQEWTGKKTKTKYLKEIETHLSNLKMPEEYITQILELTATKLSKGSIGA